MPTARGQCQGSKYVCFVSILMLGSHSGAGLATALFSPFQCG